MTKPLTVEEIMERIKKLMQTPKWQRSFEHHMRQAEDTAEQLRRDSYVDPKLLDEEVTI